MPMKYKLSVGVVFCLILYLPNFNQFRRLQHPNVHVRHGADTSALSRHEPAEGPNVACQNSGGIIYRKKQLEIRVTRKPRDGRWIRSSVALNHDYEGV